MANYAVVKNDEILELHDYVPLKWNNISNFNLLENKPEVLNSYGWCKVVKRVPEFDPEIQILSVPKYFIEENYVVETFDVINVYEDKSQFYSVRKESVLKELREKRDQLLKDSDWTQSVDLSETKPAEWLTAWKTYRQNLRDLPEQYKDIIDLDYFHIQYPEKPV